uniref:tRNA (adenine(58)-N(1))-methyltransferase n=1 Tax=Pyxicephalus adspersus TaxID=30357 RepID=A0AAV3AQN6_PYXAD|nr:TPA: hypothetical protein GDO54_011509 [Pyxicephalus adspersus]
MSPGKGVPRLCRALLSRTLPPAGGAATLLSCRHRLHIQRAVSYSDCPGGGDREDEPGHQRAAGSPGSGRLLRRAWGRSLSPLDRVSRMIPPEFISKDVQDLQGPDVSSDQATPQGPLQEPTLQGTEDAWRTSQLQPPTSPLLPFPEESCDPSAPQGMGDAWRTSQPQPPTSPLSPTLEADGDPSPPQGMGDAWRTSQPQPPTSPLSPTLEADDDPSPPQGIPFRPGDLLLAEYRVKYHSMFKKMFFLKQHGKFISNWGAIDNQDIVGKLPGQKLKTSTGHKLMLRRPSLEEYVKFMKRGPNIAYPKDMTAMMMVMDISPGDVVLEAGSGSGAFSLFLSRAVGSDGCVYSFDVRADHHQAVLDMLNPQVALPVVVGNLKQGAVCAVYIANITQVIDLLEGIRCCKLPLMCDKIIEVGFTDWIVTPSLGKSGRISKRVEPRTLEELEQEEEKDDDDDDTDEDDECPAGSEAFGQIPYIARPLPWQTGHTAFLVHLRKFKAPTD